MRVLLNAPAPEKHGGVANYCRAVASHFRSEVEIVHRGSRREETGAAARLRRMVRDVVGLAGALRQKRFDVVHQNTSLGLGGMLRDTTVIVLAKLFRRRLVIFFHGWDDAFAERFGDPVYAPLRALYFRADALIVLAERFKTQLRAWGYRGPVYVETTPVDDAVLAEAVTLPAKDRFTILFLARIEANKGIFVALDAVHELARRGHAARLVVAGDGGARAEAEAYAEREGIENVRFAGYVRGADKARLLAEADAYLLPTTHGEGMPTTVLEALAFGVPVVTRPVGGLVDILEDGTHGFLTERTDAGTFADLVERLLQDPALAAQMRSTNQAYAAERFLASQVAHRLDAIYAEVAA